MFNLTKCRTFQRPMVLPANYFHTRSGLQGVSVYIKDHWYTIERVIIHTLWKINRPLDNFDRSLLQLKNLCTMFNQIIFFVLCDTILVPDQRVTCLYTLMFYNVFAYCVSYIKELIEKKDWSPYVNLTDHSNIKHLAMTATKIVLEWTKAVTFIITVVFMLLVLGLEQGLELYKPTMGYTVVTLFYYLITEKVFVQLILNLTISLQIQTFDNLEILWVPVISQLISAFLSFAFVIPVAFYGQFKAALAGFYVNVYLKLKDSYINHINELMKERALLKPYRCALTDELASYDDVCAVCLTPMVMARLTPCKHLFHGDCLRNCLKTSTRCPLCKSSLILN